MFGLYVDSVDRDEEFLSLALIPEAWGSSVCGRCPQMPADVNPNGFFLELQTASRREGACVS